MRLELPRCPDGVSMKLSQRHAQEWRHTKTIIILGVGRQPASGPTSWMIIVFVCLGRVAPFREAESRLAGHQATSDPSANTISRCPPTSQVNVAIVRGDLRATTAPALEALEASKWKDARMSKSLQRSGNALVVDRWSALRSWGVVSDVPRLWGPLEGAPGSGAGAEVDSI